MLHHTPGYIGSVDAAKRETAARRRPPVDAGELERIVRSAAAGDGSAWARIVRQFAPRLRAVARSYRLPLHEAEDVAQTTWLRLFEHIAHIRDPTKLGAWLETTARNESVRVIQRRRPVQWFDEPPETGEVAAPAEAALLERERSDALAAAVQRLPAHQRAVVGLLLAESEPTYAEMATSLGLPIGSIGPTRARLLERLRGDRELIGVVEGDRC